MKMALDLTLDALVSNSEKYGASEIIIELVERSDDFILSVKDDGEGMDELSLERYGTPFNTSNSRQGGSGIGVYFALQLIENGGWKWTVNSIFGVGTTVSLLIPKSSVLL
jgi:signal transduction histidine kinase